MKSGQSIVHCGIPRDTFLALPALHEQPAANQKAPNKSRGQSSCFL